MIMSVAIWDTYVTKKDGSIMHFDIIIPSTVKNSEIIYGYGLEYLRSKGMGELSLTAKECTFCHIENTKPKWEDAIIKNGYYIYEMENCN